MYYIILFFLRIKVIVLFLFLIGNLVISDQSIIQVTGGISSAPVRIDGCLEISNASLIVTVNSSDILNIASYECQTGIFNITGVSADTCDKVGPAMPTYGTTQLTVQFSFTKDGNCKDDIGTLYI